MRNIQLVIEYDGSRYDGWQKAVTSAKNAASAKGGAIQEKIEEVLAKMENKPVELVGAIRTEAGVHAYRQVANFHTDSTRKTYEIKQYLNRYLPRDIAVLEALEVGERFHAAFNAKGYVFEYRITIGEVPSVFDRKYNYYCFKRPDLAAMKAAAGKLTGTNDYKAFSDNKRMKKSTVRTISSIDVYGDEKEITVTVTGDDFWPNMARILVGTILDAGLGELAPEDIPDIMASGDRERAGRAVEPKGLFLVDVKYA
ncbi:MAG: tRNA pseudouridine(38-40) synthase TruA [Lachnospiraceae bacterium]|nr:tRNA pseudouridine(38-40) synthase TruA [Lachnospiraceae bacterium]